MADETAPDHSLEIAYLIGAFMAEHLVRVYREFGGDLQSAVVLANVAHHNMQRYYEEVARRSPEGFDALVEAKRHLESLRHCNTNSVSEATGIPRETVRRKVRALAAKGLLVIGERGELTMAADVGSKFVDFNAESSRQFVECARRVLPLVDK